MCWERNSIDATPKGYYNWDNILRKYIGNFGRETHSSNIIKSTICNIDRKNVIQGMSYDGKIFQIQLKYRRCDGGDIYFKCDIGEKKYDIKIYQKIEKSHIILPNLSFSKSVSDHFRIQFQTIFENEYFQQKIYEAGNEFEPSLAFFKKNLKFRTMIYIAQTIELFTLYRCWSFIKDRSFG